MDQITMKQLHDRLSSLSGQEVVLDVREPEEYAEGHVPGSLNIPLGDLNDRVSELKRFERIYVHCQAGGRAQLATDLLMQSGLTQLVCIADGGMGDWIAAGYPVAR